MTPPINTEKEFMLSISILLSVYNGEKTLERCLQSIESQTFSNTHILCIDDASTDNSPAILEAWRKKLGAERMTIVRNNENLGLTRSLNKGIDRATTPLIARIDADDWWEPTKLEKQVAFLVAHPEYGVVGTNYINHIESQDKKVTLPETD
jgi:glycosyltransferase involved in cell wall biosynthesis